MKPEPAPHRERCYRCYRPAAFCLCSAIPALSSKTRLVLLQHPREEFVAIGTARMAALSVVGATHHVGVSFEDDAQVRALAASPDACLLFPSEGAVPIEELRGQRRTLFVVDGTWSQAKKLLTRNPFLAALPRVAFTPKEPSRYRIRREPSDECVSTIEAISHVMSVLEDDDRFSQMLAPFDEMIEAQIRFKREVGASRHAKKERKVPQLVKLFADEWEHLVCVSGEANAWPYRGLVESPDELISFVAERVATGEKLRVVVRPTHPLAPATAFHTEMSEEEIMAGVDHETFQRSLAAFFRDDDVVASWGFFAIGRAKACGAAFPSRLVDVRRATTTALHRKVGLLPDLPAVVAGFAAPETAGLQRAGRRLALTVAAAGWLRQQALAKLRLK